MPCRAKNKTISRTNRLISLNRNACHSTEMNVIYHLESIGNSIIDQLKGSKHNHLKQQLLTSVSISTNSPSRQLRDVLADLHAFNCFTQREYRTVGIGDENISTLLEINSQETKTMNTFNDVPKRKTRRNLTQTIDNETKKTLNVVTRTICTRSSKLNTLNNNNQEQINLLPNRTQKRRLSSNTRSPITTDNSPKNSDINILESTEEDVTRNVNKC